VELYYVKLFEVQHKTQLLCWIVRVSDVNIEIYIHSQTIQCKNS